jgi:hypothetical protein
VAARSADGEPCFRRPASRPNCLYSGALNLERHCITRRLDTGDPRQPRESCRIPEMRLRPLLLWVLLFARLGLAQDRPLPDKATFIEEFRKQLSTPDQLLSQYTYTYKETEITLDSAGKPKKTETDVYQVVHGAERWETYERQIVKKGKPVSEVELEKQDRKERQRVEKERSKRARWSEEKRRREKAKTEEEERKTNDDVFASFNYDLVRRDILHGRPAILVNFKPNKLYRPKTGEAKQLQHVAGRIWISESDHQLAKLEAEVVEPIKFGAGILAKLQKGSTVQFELQKINDEIWLPVRGEILYDARVLMLKGMKGRVIVEFSDHRKFNVDTNLQFNAPARRVRLSKYPASEWPR